MTKNYIKQLLRKHADTLESITKGYKIVNGKRVINDTGEKEQNCRILSTNDDMVRVLVGTNNFVLDEKVRLKGVERVIQSKSPLKNPDGVKVGEIICLK